MIPTAKLASRRALLLILILLTGGILWSARQIVGTEEVIEGHGHELALLWVFVFVSLIWHITLAWCERPLKATRRQQKQLDGLKITVNVPLYNEDPQVVRVVLASLFGQTRLPNRIQVVDDGSTSHDYTAQIAEFRALAAFYPQIDVSWVRTPNGGKRHAQITTFGNDPDADIFVTMDSDTVLERNAIAEGLKPFANPAITSVTALILAYNTKASFFTRVTDPWLMAFQLCVRSALSRLSSVLVNSGNLAFYRAEIVRKAIPSYESELFFGRPVQYSDDSLLTTFSYLSGKTVQQPTSFAFTVLPENVSHHIRQQLRWMRGSFIRSWWRFKYLPIRSFAYWEHFFSWMNFVLVTVAFADLFIVQPLLYHKAIPVLFVFAIGVAYAMALKYLLIRRSDHSFGYQLCTFLLTPLMLTWTALVLRPLRLYAMLTCLRTGWGTRGDVEVEVN